MCKHCIFQQDQFTSIKIYKKEYFCKQIAMTTAQRLSVKIDMKLEQTTIHRSSSRKRKCPPPSPEYESNSSYSEEEEDSYDEEIHDERSNYKRKNERQLMRPWLIDQVEKGDIPGLKWLDGNKTLIKIPWTHASRHGWEACRDSSLFKMWAQHTGKYTPKDQDPESGPKKWKANFRCAMNSLPDVEEEKKKSCKKGHNAFKVYKLLPEKKRGCGGVQHSKKVRSSSESDTEQHYKRYVTNADRLERHKTIKELKKKIESRQHLPEQDQTVPENFSTSKTTCTGPMDAYEEDRKPIVIPICTKESWFSRESYKYGLNETVADRIEEVITTPLTVLLHDSKVEHSYAKPGNEIPRPVVEQQDATSDYMSNSGSDQDMDDIVQEIEKLQKNSPVGYDFTDQKFFPEQYPYSDMHIKRSDSMDNCFNPDLSTCHNSFTSFSQYPIINNNNHSFTFMQDLQSAMYESHQTDPTQQHLESLQRSPEQSRELGYESF